MDARKQKSSKKAQDERIRLLREWASTLDAMQELIVITDLNGVIRRVNRAVADHLGLPFQEIIGQQMSRFFGEFGDPTQTSTSPSEVTLPFCEGLFAHSRFPNFDPDGERIGVIHVFRDITEEKRVRERLMEAEKLSTLAAVLSGVAHEINNPLAAVLGFAQLAYELSTEPEVKDCLQTVQTEAENVSRIVKNLLAFARRSRPRVTRVPLSEALSRARDLLAYQMRLAKVTLTLSVPEDIPDILGDLEQLEQVFVALLLFVTREARRQKEGLGIRVTAKGIGPSRVSVLIDIDRPFMEVRNLQALLDFEWALTQDRDRGGLSLAIANSIVTQHGGRLEVGPSGQGVCFAVELPAVEPLEEGLEGLDNGTFDLTGLRILVADDDAVSARLLSRILATAGASVEVVSDGESAWERLSSSTYDVFVTDFRMPGLDAKDILSRLWALQRPEAQRTVIVTGDILNQEVEDFLAQSGLPTISKPFSIKAVRKAVTEVLHRSQG